MIGLLLMEPQCYPESHEHAHPEVTTNDAKVTIIKPFGSFAAFFTLKKPSCSLPIGAWSKMFSRQIMRTSRLAFGEGQSISHFIPMSLLK
ncbi:hypothetical protein RC77_00115 [Pectobacterium brasiliense]|nr:hypothetical protein RC77_00115 [Pectobacterium brasiliense]